MATLPSMLRILLAVVGGHVQLPDLQRSAALFRQLKDEERGRFSLARGHRQTER
jgi:hypothetical protein